MKPIAYLLGVPFGALFLGYLFLVTAPAYTLIGLVASIDGAAVRRQLTGAVPARTRGFSMPRPLLIQNGG